MRSEKHCTGRTADDIPGEPEYPMLYVDERAWCDFQLMSISLDIRQIDEEADSSKDYHISIYFTHPSQMSDYSRLYDKPDDRSSRLTTQLYNFIRDLEVTYAIASMRVVLNRKTRKDKNLF
jgi:hypothetical protein